MPVVPSQTVTNPPGQSLQQVYDQCNKISYFSREDDEIWDAINDAGFSVYCAILKEYKGQFIKWDETSVTLALGTEEYALPIDLKTVVRLSEKLSASDEWRPMNPIDINSALFTDLNQSLESGFSFGPSSEFGYYGPYLSADDAQSNTQTYKIRVEPSPQETRLVQVIYTAKWVQVLNAKTPIMLPFEAMYAVQNKATANLLRRNDDSLADRYEQTGQRSLMELLTLLRDNQIQLRSYIEPYVGDLD